MAKIKQDLVEKWSTRGENIKRVDSPELNLSFAFLIHHILIDFF